MTKNRLHFSVFLLISVIILITFCYSSYRYTLRPFQSEFEKKYALTLDNLRETLLTLEQDADAIARNAAYSFRERYAEQGFPKPSEYDVWKKQYGVGNLFAITSNGDLVLATDGNTVENGGLTGINFFKICDSYRDILTHDIIVQTPILYNTLEVNQSSFKYTMIASKDKSMILEVSISVQTIIDRLIGAFRSDTNIERVTLYSPNGTPLITSAPLPSVSPEADLMKLVKPNVPIMKWINKDLIYLNQFRSRTNNGICCECVTKNLAPDENYYYYLAAIVSGSEVTEKTYQSFYFLIGLTGILLACLIIAWTQYNSRKKVLQLQSLINHDIKTPMKTLEMLLQTLKLTDEDKNKIKQTLSSIRGVLHLYEEDQYSWSLQRLFLFWQSKKEICYEQLIAPQLMACISQVSISHRVYKNIQITCNCKNESLFAFSKVNSSEFSRSISNIINNSVEAITKNGEDLNAFGKVTAIMNLDDNQNSNQIIITITDSGIGISPEVLPHIFENGFSYGKKSTKHSGKGIGLSAAKTYINSWCGTIEAQSTLLGGTAITIRLPLSKTVPSWFIKSLSILRRQNFILIDDDKESHELFKMKITLLNNEQHACCSVVSLMSAAEFEKYIETHGIGESIIFMDLELDDNSNSLDGIDLIMKHSIHEKSILLTNRWAETKTQERCLKEGIWLFPKSLVELFEFVLLQDHIQPTSCVVIDDNEGYLEEVSALAKIQGKNVSVYKSVRLFLMECNSMSTDVDICLDSDLGNGIQGEDELPKILEKGFFNIYSISYGKHKLAQGFIGRRDKACPWNKIDS